MARGINKVILVERYRSGESIPIIAAAAGVSRSTVRKTVADAGALRSRADGVRRAAAAGRLGAGMRGKTRKFSESHKAAIRAGRLAACEATAAGNSLKPSGYIEITRGANKNRGEHRVIAEQIIGRKLLPGEVVHHKDRNRANNDPSNLQVMSRSDHIRLHRMEGW